MTVRDDLLVLVERDQALPLLDEWLDELAHREAVDLVSPLAALVRAGQLAGNQLAAR